MARCRVYLDLDNTLIAPIERGGEVVEIRVRPDAGWFLDRMASHCKLRLLTWAMRDHAEQALRKIGRPARHIREIISREDLAPIYEQLEVVKQAEVSDEERAALYREIAPIAPPGVIFDDYFVGSTLFAIKSRAVGVGDESWIEVDMFAEGVPDREGLRKAYAEFRMRFQEGFSPRMATA